MSSYLMMPRSRLCLISSHNHRVEAVEGAVTKLQEIVAPVLVETVITMLVVAAVVISGREVVPYKTQGE